MHIGLDSPNHVTTRHNGQQSVQSRTRSSTRVNLQISFLSFKWESFFFLKKIQMVIFGFFLIQMCSLFPKKVRMKQSFRKLVFLESFFLGVIFCLEKLRKDERHLKKRKERKKKRKTQQTQKKEDN